jgi:hypothetical protein
MLRQLATWQPIGEDDVAVRQQHPIVRSTKIVSNGHGGLDTAAAMSADSEAGISALGVLPAAAATIRWSISSWGIKANE